MIRYPSVESVLLLQSRQTREGVRDMNLIESAVARPQASMMGQDAHEDIWEKAAALLHGLASTQGFMDGNKRTAWLSTVSFLEANGWEVERVPTVDAVIVGLAASVGAVELGELAGWLQTHSHRRSGPAENVPDGLSQTPFGWMKGNFVQAPTKEVTGLVLAPEQERTRIWGVRPTLTPENAERDEDAKLEDQEIEFLSGISLPTPMFLEAVTGTLLQLGFRIKNPQPPRTPAPVPDPQAPSRNGPCPCGSEKKYKLCHGRAPAV